MEGRKEGRNGNDATKYGQPQAVARAVARARTTESCMVPGLFEYAAAPDLRTLSGLSVFHALIFLNGLISVSIV
jgi:hypothetical protein